MSQVTGLVNSIERSRKQVLASVKSLSWEQASYKPDAGEWSVNELLEHLYLAEYSGISKIWGAAEGWHRGRPVWTGEHTNRGQSI